MKKKRGENTDADKDTPVFLI
jgi:Sec-independent protein translocase protein TatA